MTCVGDEPFLELDVLRDRADGAARQENDQNEYKDEAAAGDGERQQQQGVYVTQLFGRVEKNDHGRIVILVFKISIVVNVTAVSAARKSFVGVVHGLGLVDRPRHDHRGAGERRHAALSRVGRGNL